MLVPQSERQHPEFDLEEARRVYANAGCDKNIEGELITSPHDLFCVETLRDRFNLRVGRAMPADVFVFGKGEPPRPDCTQVGGNPFWPTNREWPTNGNGSPYRFLAQISFADSLDLVGDLPAELLLLFVDVADDWLWQEPLQIHLEWVALGSGPRSNIDRSLIAEKAGPFYGAIFRSADYPDTLEIASGLEVDESWNLPILNGTKIGGVPHFIQGGEGVSGQLLWQLASIQAAPYAPYPWVNRPEPLGLESDQNGIYGDENSILFGDMGAIYIYRDDSGQVLSAFESY
jgi:Domain of unknown function (DUF1963)